MLKVFQWHTLPVQKVTSGSLIFQAEGERILMPRRFAPATVEEHTPLAVFVYRDSTGCLAATTEAPLAKAQEFAFLKAVAADKDGVYLEWGPGAPLFLEHHPERQPREVGKHYLVKLLVDADGELVARADQLKTLSEDGRDHFERGQEVQLLIGYPSPLGYKCIINHTHSGILYDNQVFEALSTGETRTGYIDKIREDGKIDLSLRKGGYHEEAMDKNAQKILNALYRSGGRLPYHDKSDPEVIREQFGMSKKVFKQTIGRLYKAREIEITPRGIRKL